MVKVDHEIGEPGSLLQSGLAILQLSLDDVSGFLDNVD